MSRLCRAIGVKYTDLTLQLGNAGVVQHKATVAVVVKRSESAQQLEGESRLVSKDGAESPSTNYFVNNAMAAPQEGLSTANRQIVGSAEVHHVAQVKCSRTIALAQVAD